MNRPGLQRVPSCASRCSFAVVGLNRNVAEKAAGSPPTALRPTIHDAVKRFSDKIGRTTVSPLAEKDALGCGFRFFLVVVIPSNSSPPQVSTFEKK